MMENPFLVNLLSNKSPFLDWYKAEMIALKSN